MLIIRPNRHAATISVSSLVFKLRCFLEIFRKSCTDKNTTNCFIREKKRIKLITQDTSNLIDSFLSGFFFFFSGLKLKSYTSHLQYCVTNSHTLHG